MDKLIAIFKSCLQIKGILIISGLLFLPIVASSYWLFESGYLGFFGIGPELYSRPVFSSGFMSAWLFSISFVLLIKTLVLACLFFGLFSLITRITKRKALIASKKAKEVSKIDDNPEKEKVFRFKDVEDAFKIPLLVFGGGVIASLVISIAVIVLTKEGEKIAQKQMKAYLSEPFYCFDGFNPNNVGCFEIEGIEKKDLLVLTNTKTHIIYLSRTEKECDNVEVAIEMIEKKPALSYKIRRHYRSSQEISTASKSAGKPDIQKSAKERNDLDVVHIPCNADASGET